MIRGPGATAQWLGQQGEAVAAAYLLEQGFEILARNWRYGRWELDLVCRRNETIHFVEVKTRSGRSYGGAVGAVHPAKQRRMALAAQAWLLAQRLWRQPCQFDIICLIRVGNSLTVEPYPNAFNCEIMGSGHAHWPYG